MGKPRVFIVDKSLDGSPPLPRSAPTITVMSEAQDALQAIILAGQLQPDVILLNVDALCAEDVQLIARISQLYPGIKLIVVTGGDAPQPLVLEAYRQGARAYLAQAHSTPSEIVEAIHAVVRGQSILDSQMAGWILDEITRIQER